MRKIAIAALSWFLSLAAVAQVCKADSTGNNLVHAPGYKTSAYGSIPKYRKTGKGAQTLILIPGLGFDAGIFDDFIKANKQAYTMYAITIPGYGQTQAPAMPVTDTSFGKQYWNKGVVEGILKLIEKEKIQKPILVGHFTQGTQLALRMAIDNPGKFKAVIVLGGPAKFIYVDQEGPKQYSLPSMVSYIDKYTAPGWFKTISKKRFDDGNYAPGLYSLDSIAGKRLSGQVAAVPLPVMVRYLCEFFASDITLDFDKIKCPVLVLKAGYTEAVLTKPENNYIKPQFVDAWNNVHELNPLITVVDIPESASFVWKDQPAKTNDAIKKFIQTIPD